MDISEDGLEGLGEVILVAAEDVLLVEVVDDHEVVGGEVVEVDEGPLELAGHLVVEVDLRLRHARHALQPAVVPELQHQLPLLHLLPHPQLQLVVLPHPPHALPDELPRRLPQLRVLLQPLQDVQGLRFVLVIRGLLLFMAKAWVRTTTMTDTMRTPQLTQRVLMSLPIWV